MAGTARSVRFCERAGIAHPIVGAPMGGGPSTPELVAAVAEAGGLGSIAAGYLSPAQLAGTINEARRLTRGSLAINIFVPPDRPLVAEMPSSAMAVLNEIAELLDAPRPSAALPDPEVFDRQVSIAADCDAAMVSFTFGLPSAAVVDRLRDAGKLVGATANTRAEAEAVAAVGCDAVIVQGFEAGAHRGGLSLRGDRHVGLMALLEETRDLGTDVIASGGVTTGAGVAACLALGAVAAQIGTAFLVSDESGATPEWKKAVLTSVDAETTITEAVTGRAARGVPNALLERLESVREQLPDYPILNSYTAAIRRRAKELGDPEYQSLWTGQAGSVARTGPARAIFGRLVEELDDAVEAFAVDGSPR